MKTPIPPIHKEIIDISGAILKQESNTAKKIKVIIHTIILQNRPLILLFTNIFTYASPHSVESHLYPIRRTVTIRFGFPGFSSILVRNLRI